MGEKKGGARIDSLDMFWEPVGEEDGIGIWELRAAELILVKVGEVLVVVVVVICCSLAERIEADRVRMVLDGTDDVEAMLTDELRRPSACVACDDELLT